MLGILGGFATLSPIPAHGRPRSEVANLQSVGWIQATRVFGSGLWSHGFSPSSAPQLAGWGYGGGGAVPVPCCSHMPVALAEGKLCPSHTIVRQHGLQQMGLLLCYAADEQWGEAEVVAAS